MPFSIFNITILPVDAKVFLGTSDKVRGLSPLTKQQSVLLYGATGVGKTALVLRGRGKSWPEIEEEVTRGINYETSILERRKNHRLVIGDPPGDNKWGIAKIRQDYFDIFNPLAIILMLDHAPRLSVGQSREQFNDLYKYPGHLPDGRNNAVRIRYEEHISAISELASVIQNNESVQRNCQFVLPLVNKRDHWSTLGYERSTFVDWYYDELTNLNVLLGRKIKTVRPIGYSIREDNFESIERIITEKVGTEVQILLSSIFNWEVKIPMSRK